MNFSVKSELDENVAVLYPKGHLDAHSVEKFEKEILGFIKKNIINIIINCKELDYISSAGMGIIMGNLDEIKEKGGDIKLCAVNDRVFEIFDLVGFTEIYDFLDTETEAKNKFNNEK
jgi:anti-sigma B factor antagonist